MPSNSHHHLKYHVPAELISLFHQQAAQKIRSERWVGRNTEVKIQNFVRCWATEEAFKQLLMQHRCWFRYRGLYFGDAAGAGADFTVRINGKELTLGLRSIAADSLKWQSVAYPDDRFRDEKEKIANYHIACIVQDNIVTFLGIISKAELLAALEHSPRRYSRKNQEYFRVIPLEKFEKERLRELFEVVDRA